MKYEARSCEHSILAIRTGALGDTILTLPVLASIRAAHPGEAVVFLGNRAYRELIPEEIEFHPVDAPEWSWLFRSCEPGECGEDLFVKRSSRRPSPKTLYASRNSASPTEKPNSEHNIELFEGGSKKTLLHKKVSPTTSLFRSGCLSAGAPDQPRTFHKAYVILNRPDDVVKNLARTGIRTLIHAPSLPLQGKHVVEHLHEALGLKTPARCAAFETMRQAEERLIWLHPGSGGPKKCVPLRAIVQIASKLRAATGFELVVTAGEEDEFLKAEAAWGDLMGQPGVTLVQNRPLPELVRRLSRAAIFIGNDSGISHLAANLGVRSVVFFVASDPVQWAPWVPEQGLRIIDLTDQDLGRNEWMDMALAQALDFLLNCIP